MALNFWHRIGAILFLFFVVIGFASGCATAPLDTEPDDTVLGETDAPDTDAIDTEIPCDKTIYYDGDRDGFGDKGTTREWCDSFMPDSWTAIAGDCDDTRDDVHPDFGPDHHERDDGIDDDCDGEIDEDHAWASTDIDGDGFPQEGDPVRVARYEILSSLVLEDEFLAFDCDDNDPFAFPGGSEHPADNRDGDCDGFELCYEDLDGDRAGTHTIFADDLFCVESGLSLIDGDCDDTRDDVHPRLSDAIGDAPAYELLDGVDNNCDGRIDEYECEMGLSFIFASTVTADQLDVFVLPQFEAGDGPNLLWLDSGSGTYLFDQTPLTPNVWWPNNWRDGASSATAFASMTMHGAYATRNMGIRKPMRNVLVRAVLRQGRNTNTTPAWDVQPEVWASHLNCVDGTSYFVICDPNHDEIEADLDIGYDTSTGITTCGPDPVR